jgi:hypothetical protein
MNKLIKGLFLLALFAALFSSCKSTRPVIKAPLKEEGPEYLYTKLKESELKFDWLSLKFDASYTEKRKDTDFKGQIRIRKDSIIWLSITPAMGIEMIRMVITNDSVKYINRFEKNYFAGDYKLVSDFLQIHVDFDILQAIILGNDFQFYENNSFRAAIDDLEYRLSTQGRRKIKKEAEDAGTASVILVQNIWLNADSYKITRVDLKEFMKDNRKLEARYEEFIPLENQVYPSVLRYNILAEDLLKIRINYNKVTLNEPMAFPFSVPENYEKINR